MNDKVSQELYTFVTERLLLRKKTLYRSVSNLQKEIIRKHKTICLLPYYMLIIENKKQQQQRQGYLSNMTETELIQSLFQQTKSIMVPKVLIFNQESSFLINYLENNSTELAREVVKSKSTLNILDYYHLIFQIIPSIFGYFHSQEHLDSASIFYQNIVDFISEDPKTSVRIFQPFLNSPSTYRYIEYVMNKLFKKLILSKRFKDIDFNDKTSVLYQEYNLNRNKVTKKFLHYLTKAIPLLPIQILHIFRKIKRKYNDKWSTNDWYKLFFSIFINQHISRWSHSHFFNKEKKVENSPKPPNIQKDQKKLKKRTFSFSTNSSLLLPNAFPSSFYGNVGFVSKEQKINIIRDLVKNVLNDLFKRDFDYFIESLCSVESIYSTPQMYKCFDNMPTTYNITIKDMKTLVYFLDERKILPSFVKIGLFHYFSDDNENLNTSYYLNIYTSLGNLDRAIQPIVFPKISIDPNVIQKYNEQIEYRSRLAHLESSADEKNRISFALEQSIDDPEFNQYVKTHMIIQNANSSESFEEFIELLRLHKEIENWDTFLSSYYNSIFLNYWGHFQEIPEVFILLPKKVKLLNYLQNFDEDKFNIQFKQFNNLCLNLDSYVDVLLKKSHIFNDGIQNKSSLKNPKILKYLQTYDNLNNVNIDLPLYFFKALSLFSLIVSVDFPEKYEFFMSFLDIIDVLFPKNNKTLILLFVKQVSAYDLLKVFVEISTFVIHNKMCFKLIPTANISKWQQFENLIYEIVSFNVEIFQQILNCQIYFQEFFSIKVK